MQLNKAQTPASDLIELLRAGRPAELGSGSATAGDFAAHVEALRREPAPRPVETAAQRSAEPTRAREREPERSSTQPAERRPEASAEAAENQDTRAAAASSDPAGDAPLAKPQQDARRLLLSKTTATAAEPAVDDPATSQLAEALAAALPVASDAEAQASALPAEETPSTTPSNPDLPLQASATPLPAPRAELPQATALLKQAQAPAADEGLETAAVGKNSGGKGAAELLKSARAAQEPVADDTPALAQQTAATETPITTAPVLVAGALSRASQLLESRRTEGASLQAVGLSAAGLTSANPAPAEAAPASASLAHAPGTPAFQDELSSQLLLWVKGGVQQAELRLNPAELGPVQVRIQLDGQQAQVQFGAEQAQTRQALEASLPELARALEGEGLQWQGGGVQAQLQQQSQQSQRQAEAESARDGRPDSGGARRLGLETLAPATGQPRALRGLVDLYA